MSGTLQNLPEVPGSLLAQFAMLANPVILFCSCCLDLSFFAAQSPRSLSQSSLHFATCSMVTQIYKIRVRNSGSLSQKLWQSKEDKKFATVSDKRHAGGYQQPSGLAGALQRLTPYKHNLQLSFSIYSYLIQFIVIFLQCLPHQPSETVPQSLNTTGKPFTSSKQVLVTPNSE